jgi:uncharacterized protein (TIGR03083 family)
VSSAPGLEPLLPLDVRPLFPGLHRELVALLRGLALEDWARPTIAGAWRVRDVAAHLLDSELRRLSAQRDGHRPSPEREIASEADLVAFLDGLNADWVRASGRLSPRVLLDLLSATGAEVAALFESLDPEGEALYPVAWAGEAASRTWFDLGREYTEQWHHQQQIRLAVGAPLLDGPEWLRPVLDLSVRALPHRYRGMTAAEGESVQLVIQGRSGGEWTLLRQGHTWRLYAGHGTDEPAARIALDEGVAWRVFFKALTPDAASAVRLEGRPELGRVFLSAYAVMAC